MVLEDIEIHLFGMNDFNPDNSYGSVIIKVPDPDALYHLFAERLRKAYGKLPVAGIPRILRPRKKYGSISGFSIVDPGGNWLRVYRLDDSEREEPLEKANGLIQYINVAARLGDEHGDDTGALKTLESGIKRFPKAAALERKGIFVSSRASH